MAKENELQIILSLVDDASEELRAIAKQGEESGEKIKSSFEKASKATVSFGNDMRMMGRTVSSVGMTMSFFGAGITAPFILALKNSAEHSIALKMRMDNLKATFGEFQIKMATAIIPIVDRFSNVVANLNNFLNSLSSATVNTVMQTIMMTGIFLTFGGILTIIVGKIMVLTGALTKLFGMFIGFAAANLPLIVIAGSIALLTFLMFKFQAVSNTVMSTFQVLFLVLKNGFDGIVIIVEGAVLGVLTAIQWIIDKMAIIPGATQEMFQNLSNNIQGITDTLRDSIQLHTTDIQTNVNTISSVFQTGVGTWSQSFDKFKAKIGEVVYKIKGIGTAHTEATKVSAEMQKKMTNDTVAALDTLNMALQGAKEMSRGWYIAAQAAAIAMIIIHTAVGAMKAWADYGWPLGAVIAGIIIAAGAIQIATVAAQKFAEGGRPPLGRASIVGERGPELFVPDTYGTIIPNNRLSNMGNQTSIHIEINNPVVRSDEDIDKLTEEISLRLAMEAERI